MTQTLQILDQTFILHPTGALFWKEQEAILISDVHLGKVGHFRKFGAAVPQKALFQNYTLLDTVIEHFKPKHLFFLGDLFHSSINKEWQIFEQWVRTTSPKIVLIAGNHDIISPLKYEVLHIEVVQELVIATFLLTHHPEERAGYFNFSGHIHPAIRLKGSGKQSLKLSCFFKDSWQMILPAFGEFTGTHVLKPSAKNEVFAITKNEVILVSN